MNSHMSRLVGIGLLVALALSSCAPAATPSEAVGTVAAVPSEAVGTVAAVPSEAPAEETAPRPRAVSIHNAAITDSLYDQIEVAGLTAMGEQYGFETSSIDQTEDARVAEVMRTLAADGVELVITTSGGHEGAFLEVAPEFPETWFIMVCCGNTLPESPNAAEWSLDLYEEGFLAGVVAGLQSTTGRIGFVAGAPIPPIFDLASGMWEGARYVNPNIEFEFGVIGDFVDVAKASEITESMIARGADVFWAAAGSAGRGMIEAADRAGMSVVGYMGDENFRAPETVITSVLVDYTAGYLELGELYTTGGLEPAVHIMGVGGGYFTYAPFRGRVLPGVEETALEIIGQIGSGELVIPRVDHTEELQS